MRQALIVLALTLAPLTASADSTRVRVSGDTYESYREGDTNYPTTSSPAPQAYATSGSEAYGCGETTGAAAQGSTFGVSLGTIPEGCRAVQAAEASARLVEMERPWRARAVTATYWAGFVPRLLVHVLSGGILN